jgi:UDP-N-acetylglucosamine--N-acetylmuramyl-(pentapeptide) pyrophosphoryl-undecaprenol N-acetylglucosamine transferase
MLLGKNAVRVFTGTDGMEKFFPPLKISVTGNPVRTVISNATVSKNEGIEFFSLDPSRKTLLVVGGSLGAKSINEAIDKGLDDILATGMQIIWQTGKPYAEQAKNRVKGKQLVWANDFITQMEYAYAAADIVVARAGAMTVAELCVVQKPVLFVPYPFAAEDHQTVNAMQLVNRQAALVIKDAEAATSLVPMAIALGKDENKQQELRRNIALMAIRDADKMIATQVLKKIASPLK